MVIIFAKNAATGKLEMSMTRSEGSMRECKVHFYDWTLHEKGRALCGIDIFTLRLMSSGEVSEVDCLKCLKKYSNYLKDLEAKHD